MTSGSSTREERQAKAAILRAQAAKAEARRRTAIVGSAVVAVLVLMVGVFVVIQNARRETAVASTATPANLTSDGGVVVGQAGAPVTVAVYADFLCPACHTFEQTNSAQLDAWVADGTIKIEYRPVSILDRASTDEYSTRSLNAAGAVINSAPGSFAAFNKALFAEQPAERGPGLSNDRLIELAVAAGAPEAAVSTAVTNQTYRSWTVRTTESASKAGLTGTPWVLVNGTPVDGAQDPTALKNAVDTAAAQK